jgi:transglutaminase-like putative cysteine protease
VPRDRSITITVAVACVLASVGLSSLFIAALWFAVAVGAVIAAAGAGALTRLRPLPVPACLAAGLAGLMLYLNLIFETRHSLLFAIPTPGSLTRLLDLAGTGMDQANVHAAPAPDLPGLLLLAAGGVGITAVLTDLTAVRLRLPALAGLPLLVLLSVPVMSDGGHHQFVTVPVFCLAAAGYLATLAVGGRASADAAALAMAVPVGLTSIVLALCAPVLLPAVPLSQPLSPSASAGTVTLTMAQLHEGRPTVVFSYTTTASPRLQRSDPQYFQQYVFDTLGEAGWQVTSYPAGTAQSGSIPMPPGLTDLSAAQAVTTTVTTTRDFPATDPVFLPLPYPAVQATAPGRWQADQDLMVYSTTSSLAGQTYAAVSYAVDPSQAQLATAPPLTGLPGLAQDLRLPPSYRTTALEKLAHDQTSGQTTEYGKVDALANWLSAPPFRYSLSAAPFDTADGLLSFLTRTRTGYCVQYAWAMTVLTRLLGIPARFVTGYTAGMSTRSGSYQVRNTDAHAWTEVYFPALGWIRFEPTPSGQDGTASTPNYQQSPTGTAMTDPYELFIQATTGPASPSAYAYGSGLAPKPSRLAGRPVRGAHGSSAGTTRAAALLAVIVALALALLTPAALRLTRRRWRWMHATDDAARAHAAWREFRDDLTDFGLGAGPGEPPRTVAGRVGAALPEPASAAVRRLALAEERASYAARACPSQHLRRDSATARRGLAVTARHSIRWRARVFPASLLAAVSHALRSGLRGGWTGFLCIASHRPEDGRKQGCRS